MAELRKFESLYALHTELQAISQQRYEELQTVEQLLEQHADSFSKFLDKPARNATNRTALQSGKIKVQDEEYAVTQDFINDALKLADELDLDEIEAARVLLDADAEGDQASFDRPLWVCGLLRFQNERSYLLDCMRLCIQIANDEDIDPSVQEGFGQVVDERIFGIPAQGSKPQAGAQKFVPKCVAGFQTIRSTMQNIGEKVAAQNVLFQPNVSKRMDQQEPSEIMRLKLIEQHETLSLILCAAVEKKQAESKDFKEFIQFLRKVDKYDHLLVHLIPVLGAYIATFGSNVGGGDVEPVRQLNEFICGRTAEDVWAIPSLGAAVRAWWIAEYSGWYHDDYAGYEARGINLDKEDEERTKQFMDALKDGAFDFLLAVAADCHAHNQDWQDPTRWGMRQWLQRKALPLASEALPFAPHFHTSLMTHLEVLIDAAISNIPDVLRKLRTEEDEQRQLSQTHEQDLDLERFLMIIAYAYDGRPDAAMTFWEDADSNLSGFLNWASRRASTPLVSAFCEMLQALSCNEECATAAHNFLLDETTHSGGKLKRSASLTWNQIFKELKFFMEKLQTKPLPAQSQLVRHHAKPSSDQAETEPESAMMLECYLRLIAKLGYESPVARNLLLLDTSVELPETLIRLASAQIPGRLRACVFNAFRALMHGKTHQESEIMWDFIDLWLVGGWGPKADTQRTVAMLQPSPQAVMDAILDDISDGFEQPVAFIQLLNSLIQPSVDDGELCDRLPFKEALGTSNRLSGVDVYVDYVFGLVLTKKARDITDPMQLRILQLSCLEFALASLASFNEDLIVLGNESNVNVDLAMSTSSLEAYVRLHPFARVMEWMFNEKVVNILVDIINRDADVLGQSSHDSPVVMGVLRAVQVMIKVIELQDTYLDLVRPLIKKQFGQRSRSVASGAYSAFEDGIMNHLSLVEDLGRFTNLGNPDLTWASLKLLEKISTSSNIISAWEPDGRHAHRNKAIVQLERGGAGVSIAASLANTIAETLDPVQEAESPGYQTKIFILDFLYKCLKANPDKPTIAHLLLGFRCEINGLAIEPNGAFDIQRSLFHSLLNAFIGLSVYQEELGMRGYLITLKRKILRIFQILWSSPLSSKLVMEELRATNFLFHTLLQEPQVQPHLRWDGAEAVSPEFLVTDASHSYIEFLATRAMAFEYIAKELCSVSQKRIPTVKRQIFDALNGQIRVDDDEPINIANIFDFFDFLNIDFVNIPAPEFDIYRDIDLTPCVEEDAMTGSQFNVHKVHQLALLKRAERLNRDNPEKKDTQALITQDELAAWDREQSLLLEYVIYRNRQKQFSAHRLKVLRAWTNILLVMFEANDFKGTAKMAFLLQALQATLPSLEAFSTLSPAEAFELARVAKVLLFKLDLSDKGDDVTDKDIGNLISDKLFQLFQVCLTSIASWVGSADLRALYYSICYRYLTSVVDKTTDHTGTTTSNTLATARSRAIKTIQAYGDRLLNVICDDAYGSDSTCQTAAMILLGALVHLDHTTTASGLQHTNNLDGSFVVNALNRLNFIGVLVDSLKTILQDWSAATTSSSSQPSQPSPSVPSHQQQLALTQQTASATDSQYLLSKLSLLLALCRSKLGSKFVLQSNLFRALEVSGAFSTDPELLVASSSGSTGSTTDVRALERHYTLLVYLARIVSAAVMAGKKRGSHNALQGRKFLQGARGLVVQVLKRSVGIGGGGSGNLGVSMRAVNGSAYGSTAVDGGISRVQLELEERVDELAEAFMLLIDATGFLEFEEEQMPAEKPKGGLLFH
ncbi:nucleoporin Nup186/Nup192/Nup205 [Neurospora tetraspora]|uniref:Nucleoporin Nup186/Nup192/Nup205 n=1 Tax=Neurospora tetraspora TaxID=94610 RepID=A0AAE0JB26_9PEZI|nr:nucleoporin Nup186/Nup192/Nup205 [Neurospora tetraspora]